MPACAGMTLMTELIIDFTRGKMAYRQRQGFSRRDPLARAVGIKKDCFPTIIDATAGLGRDAFILASLGCQVTLLERCPAIAVALQAGLIKANNNSDLQHTISRMQLQEVNSIEYLPNLSPENYPDVIYLDPMYPINSKSALVKQELRLVRELVGDDLDAEALFTIALQRVKKRVVVKRHRHAPTISALTPSHVIENPTIRFDVYMVTQH